MSFIERERDRIQAAMTKEEYGSPLFLQLYAASQALSYALEPGGFKSPSRTLLGEEAGAQDYLLPLADGPIPGNPAPLNS